MASAAGPQLPEQFKQLKPYLTLATQHDQREPVVAYYCRLYAVQSGMQINRSAPECKKFLAQLMDVLETSKKQQPGEEALSSDVVGQAVVEKYALRVFEKADDDDRQSRFSKNLVKQFYTAGLLFDVLNCFGELSEDLVAKKQYAKRKAMYLNKCFQTGETPIAGPLVGDGFDEEFQTGMGGNDSSTVNNSYGQPGGAAAASNYNPPPMLPPIDRPGSSRSKAYQETYEHPTAGGDNQPECTPEVIEKAQKYCKFASSALQYDDVDTAITNLEQCLALLKSSRRK